MCLCKDRIDDILCILWYKYVSVENLVKVFLAELYNKIFKYKILYLSTTINFSEYYRFIAGYVTTG